jgi:hypothetical protein
MLPKVFESFDQTDDRCQMTEVRGQITKGKKVRRYPHFEIRLRIIFYL